MKNKAFDNIEKDTEVIELYFCNPDLAEVITIQGQYELKYINEEISKYKESGQFDKKQVELLNYVSSSWNF